MRFLLVDENDNHLEKIKQILISIFNDSRFEKITDRKSLDSVFENQVFDVLVFNYHLQWLDVLDLLKTVRQHDKSLPVIMVARNCPADVAVRAMKSGLSDYVPLSELSRLGTSVNECLAQARNHSETQLKYSELKFRSLFELAGDAIFLLNSEGFVDCNPVSEKKFGFRREQLSQFDPYDFSPVRQPCGRLSREVGNEKIKSALSGKPQYFEWTHCKTDGTPFETKVSLIKIDLDGQKHLQVIINDLTEQKRTEKLIRKSETQYRLLFEKNPNPMLIYQPKTLRILAVNLIAQDRYGYSKEEFLGMSIRDIRPKEELDRFDKMMDDPARLFENTGDWHHLRKDGTIFEMEVHTHTIDWEGQKAVLALIIDISQRKKAEREIKQRLVFQETVSKISSLFVGLFDTNSAIQYALETVGRMCGASRAYLFLVRSNGTIMDNTHEWCRNDVKSQIANLKNLPTDTFPWWMKKLRRGELIHITDINELPAEACNEREILENQAIKSLIVIGIRFGGHFRGFIGFDNVRKAGKWQDDDISYLRIASELIGNALERNQVENALRSSEERYRSFFEEDLTGDYIATVDGQLLSCNPAFVRMFGFRSVKDACSHNTNYLFSESENRGKFLELLKKNKKIYELESTLLSKDGREIHVIENATGIFNAKRELVKIKGYLFDNTERRLLEDKLNQFQKMEAIGRLAGGIAHDFNNLLTVMQGYTDLMLMDIKFDHPQKSRLSAIQKTIERATSLTGQLLAFSRKQIVRPKILNLNEQIEEMTKILERIIGEDIELRTNLEPTLNKIEADSGQISQIIMNLAINARDAMTDGGSLTIHTSNIDITGVFPDRLVDGKPSDYILISIEDSGTGMDKQTKARIFEPFFTTKEEGKGTGLGLATVFGIVQQNNGFINVYSEPGEGSNFKIFWPASLDKKQITSDLSVRDNYILAGDETILVVEDQEEVRILVRDVLHKNGYTVISAEGPMQAMEIYNEKKSKIDLVLTDVIMPKINGPDMIEKLKLNDPQLNAIYMSGYSGDAINFNDIIESDTSFIQKPFTAKALLKKIREVLNRQIDLKT